MMRIVCTYAVIAMILPLLCGLQPARADNVPATLAAVADAADRICGIVVQGGGAASDSAQLEIHAELNGLAKRLATIGAGGGGKIASSEYQGLLQQDLPKTLEGVRDCKLQVFKSLQATLLPGSAPVTGPGSPPPELLQAPANAPSLDNAKVRNTLGNVFDLDLYSCSNEENGIVCYIVFSRLEAGSMDYDANNMTNRTRIIDNFHDQHRLRKAYFIDGLGNHPASVNLAQGDSIWLGLEFEAGPRPISSARLIFDSLAYSPQLRGPVSQ